MAITIDEIKAKAIPVAVRYGVDSLSLFGSYARGEADEKSDMDFLLTKGKLRGLLEYCGMINDLEDTFHCHVDLVEKDAIKDKDFLKEVTKDEVVLYARQ